MSKKLKKRLILIIVSVVLFVGVYVLDEVLTLPPILRICAYLSVFCVCGLSVVFKAIQGIKNLQFLDENFLMTIASLGAFAVGNYPEAVAVTLFYQIGEWFQSYAVSRSRKSISSLVDIKPLTATVEKDGIITTVFPEEVEVGDLLVIKTGEKFPVDGEVVSGNSYMDSKFLTGESLPLEIKEGSKVFGGSINVGGVVKCRATKTYQDSAVSKVLDLVEGASAKKSKAENFITKFARVYTPLVVICALLVAIVPSIITGDYKVWVYRALTFLVVSCPCALVISVPLGFFSGLGNCSRYGVLVKGGNYIELLAKANVIVMDKTGTVTKGDFSVSGVYPPDRKDEVLRLAGICEKFSNHPIANAIVKDLEHTTEDGYTVTELGGFGVIATKGDQTILCGNSALMSKYNIPYVVNDAIGTIVYVAKNGEFVGSIVVSDTIKEDSYKAIKEFNKKGYSTYMLTGDNELSAQAVAKSVGIGEYKSQLFPQDKVLELEKILRTKGKNQTVAYVGDGINDAPVLMRADVGIAMGGIGSDVAIESADVVLMHDKLSSLLTAQKIAQKTMRIVKSNVVFALGVKIAVLILSLFGFANMWLAVFADVGVAVIAILNSMRALLKVKES